MSAQNHSVSTTTQVAQLLERLTNLSCVKTVEQLHDHNQYDLRVTVPSHSAKSTLLVKLRSMVTDINVEIVINSPEPFKSDTSPTYNN